MREKIRQMSLYKPLIEGRSSDTSRLLADFNERTQPISEFVIAAVSECLMSGRLHVYPDYGEIEDEIARYAGVESAQVMMTNRSD